MSYDEHQQQATTGYAIRCAVITLSDTRTPASDKSGQRIRALLVEAGHLAAVYTIMPDEPAALEARLIEWLARDDLDAIFTNGGTGVSRRDRTIEVVEKMLDQTLPGFGELFRMLSWQEIGSGAMLSRATGGVAGGKLLFAMPGSTAAVELAMSKLVIPELKHLVYELRKQ